MSGQEAKEKGNAAFKSGDFVGAIGHYTAAILADPKNATYPLNRAAAYLKLGKNEDAERDCARVIELDSKSVKAWFRRGQARISLSHLEDAKSDFERVLRLDPKNDAAQQELKKVVHAIQERDSRLKKAPVNIGSSTSSSSNIGPRRRRVPITIVNGDEASSSSSGETIPTSTKRDLLQPVSSRTLEKPKSSPVSSETMGSPNDPPPTVKKPATFKEAKQNREAQQSRPGGGIFRRDGQHTLFHAQPKSTAEPSPRAESTLSTAQASPPERGKVQTPPEPTKPRAAPSLVTAGSAMTLFSFNRNWDLLRTPEARWEFLQQIPPNSLPSLFKTSLEASNLVSILQTIQHVLQHTPTSQDTKALIQDYLINLARVSRFNTVVLFMSADERRLAREVWAVLGDGVAADSPERKAWGLL